MSTFFSAMGLALVYKAAGGWAALGVFLVALGTFAEVRQTFERRGEAVGASEDGPASG